MAETEKPSDYSPGSLTWKEYNSGSNKEIYELNLITQGLAERYGLYFRNVAELHLIEGIPVDHLEPLLSSFKDLRRYRERGETTETNPENPDESIFQDRVSLPDIIKAYKYLDKNIVTFEAIAKEVQEIAAHTPLRVGLYNYLLDEAAEKYKATETSREEQV